ncbi:D-aminoacyl-tRNA deacylase-like isoform X2 [Impatiens glandulifera]|uniref:D-aminoacyl-tRNA deacylase-like isoform X2 n=1 Tax=Impatiens glandulifera TaxID=253017 RepID=UPI001FB13435|nr:D-aminoacyl-tRNA deacylase-like isoform X2 [Impatiens glandulifera]
MVTLVVATTADPASIGPASALLAMPGFHPGPTFQNISSFVNKELRLLKHDNPIVLEDHLDRRWESVTGETVDEVIFLSKHTAVSNRPALTVHPIGVPHLREDEVPPAGGKSGWAAPPNPRIGPWLRLLKSIAESFSLLPEFEVTLEATHHGPEINSPTMFVEIVSLGRFRTGWRSCSRALEKNYQNKVLLGIGGGHYVPRHMDIVMKDGVWVGHLLSGYSLTMEEEDVHKSEGKTSTDSVGGTWRQAIKVALETTKSAFPEGEVLAHLDKKSLKGWQKQAITKFLVELNVNIGKPSDFY